MMRTAHKEKYFAAELRDYSCMLGVTFSHGEGDTRWRLWCLLDPDDIPTTIEHLRAFADSIERFHARQQPPA